MSTPALSKLPAPPPGLLAAFQGGVVDRDAGAVAAAQTDPRAFVVLYDRYFAPVHRYVSLRIASPTLAEDITSHIFTTALARLGQFRGSGSFSAWLFRIAQNAVRDAYRRRRTDDSGEAALALVDPGPGPDERAIAAEAAVELRSRLASLRPDQQHLLALRYGAGLDAIEIASLLGKKPTAIRVAIHRALEVLRKGQRG